MSKHMFRNGDRVTIRSDLKKGHYSSVIPHGNPLYCNDSMVSCYAGKTAVITEAMRSDRYYLNIDKGRWLWCGSMFSDDKENSCYVKLLFDD